MNAVHPVAPEDVMAYLDGELPAAQGRDIEAHLTGCGACRELLSELQEGSTRMREWRVPEPPASLVSPRSLRPIAPKHPAAAPWPVRAWTWATRPPMLAGAAAVVLIATIPLLRPSPPVMVAGSREKPETIVGAPMDRIRAQGSQGF